MENPATRRLRRLNRVAGLCLGVLGVLLLASQVGVAHKAVTSPYTYVDHVFPIFRDQCSRCHVAGGVAPMSLMTFEEATPWVEAIRVELVGAHWPTWHAAEPYVKDAHDRLRPRDLDIVLTWALGGTPRGPLEKKPPEITLKNDWALGPPDLALQMPSPFTLPADVLEDTRDFVLPTKTTRERVVVAVDLLPGTPAMVRDALIYVKPAGTAAPDRAREIAPGSTLMVWVPGRDAAAIGATRAVVRLPAGADVVLRIHYKRTWKYEGSPMTDRSTAGLYFKDGPLSSSGLASLRVLERRSLAAGYE